jgi:hypothetical protein
MTVGVAGSQAPTIYRVSPDVETSHAGGRAVLFNRATGAATILNPTGSVLWASLSEPRTAAELAVALGKCYPDLEPALASRDTEAFLAQLLKSGLIASDAASST